MRAVQRNNVSNVRYLLNNTSSDLNGSSQSTYTPLWFAVSNGYNDLALLLLNYNASPSMVEKNISSSSSSAASSASLIPPSVFTTLLHAEDLSGGSFQNPTTTTNTSNPTSYTAQYLFSPLRASIVYSRFQIMAYLLEFNANVYELFNVSRLQQTSDGERRKFRLPRPGRLIEPRLNEDYLNALKFFHRQFAVDEASSTSSSVDLDLQLNTLNEFIDDVNVYRRMLIEFVKNLIYR